MAILATSLYPVGQQGKFGTSNNYSGTGTPAVTDDLITNITKYGIGTTHFDRTLKRLYTRIATAAALTDFSVGNVGGGVIVSSGVPATGAFVGAQLGVTPATLLSDVVAFPVGTQVFDVTNKFLYIRVATGGAVLATDFFKSTVYA